MQLIESGADDTGQIRENLGQIVCQERAQSPDEANTLGAASVEPVEAVPVVRQ
jgi:hypothetical protein